jgi:hypothetical protein
MQRMLAFYSPTTLIAAEIGTTENDSPGWPGNDHTHFAKIS